MDRKKVWWFALLALALVALALTFVPMDKGRAKPVPTATAATVATLPSSTATATATATVAATATATVAKAAATSTPRPPTATPATCEMPEAVLDDENGTPLPPPEPVGGVFKIDAAPCTRELALRDFERIYNFWSNVDGNPYERKPGYDERAEFFVPGQPAGETWVGLLQFYAKRDATYPVLDPRGYEPERVVAVYQDPAGTSVWVFYDRGDLTIPVRRISGNADAGEQETHTGIMAWTLRWQGSKYLAVAYQVKANVP